MDQTPVIVVGAGLSGLCCAVTLHEAGRTVLVLDGANRIGGRVATDRVDGFLLDRGFQVLLTSYPEVQARLDTGALQLAPFRSGSAVRLSDRTVTIADPWREPLTAIKSLLSPIMSLGDAWRAARLRRRLLRNDPGVGSAREVLDASRISPKLRHSFFEPFFRGVTLDPELGVPADYFAFLFRMFAQGSATLPKDGMGAIPAQLATRLPAGSVRLEARAQQVRRNQVVLEGGEVLAADAVVVATDGAAAAELVGTTPPPGHHSTTCLYFAVEGEAPFDERMLLLNGTGSGPILHLCCPSVVQPNYAPSGHHLVSVTVLGMPDHGNSALAASVRTSLEDWFGTTANSWRHLRTYRIPHALPALAGDGPSMTRTGVAYAHDGVVVCGDHLATPSIQGAMLAGRNAARSVFAGPTNQALD